MHFNRKRTALILGLLLAGGLGLFFIEPWGVDGAVVSPPDPATHHQVGRGSSTEVHPDTAARQRRETIPSKQPDTDPVVGGSLRWTSTRLPIVGARYTLLPAENRERLAIAEALKGSTNRTTENGEWSAQRSELAKSRIWFTLGNGLYVSFVVAPEPVGRVELEVAKCSIRVYITGLGDHRCSLATQARVRKPNTDEWSLEDYLFVESTDSVSSPLHLATQFLVDGRQGDGEFLIPAIPGVSYAINCASEKREVVKRTATVEAPGACQFEFKQPARSLEVEIVDTDGRLLKQTSGYRAYYRATSAIFRPFDGGRFHIRPKTTPDTLHMQVVLSDGELFSRPIEKKDWAAGSVRITKGSGQPGVTFKLPKGGPPKSNGPTNPGVWAVVGAKIVDGTSARGIATADLGSTFYFLKGADGLTITGLKSWEELWYRNKTGAMASVKRGGRSFTWRSTRLLKALDWGTTRKFSGGKIFTARLQYRFSIHSPWTSAQMWNLKATSAPSVRLLDGVPARIMVNHGDGRQKAIVWQQ